MGGIVMPPVPAFYLRPRLLAEATAQMAGAGGRSSAPGPAGGGGGGSGFHIVKG